MKRILLVAVCLLIIATLPAQGIYQLWGMTAAGGADGAGVIFSTDAAGDNFQVRHNFRIDNSGADPNYTELIEYNGKFYGMTLLGGSTNQGVIFEWDPVTNIYTKKKDFKTADGSLPYGSLSLNEGKFYGMTSEGGTNNRGVIFEWDPATNIYTKKFDFNDERNPYGNLTLKGGKFYGMTFTGGAHVSGVIFEWDPVTNVYTKKIDLGERGIGDGANPRGSLVLYNGKFYGTTYDGGINERGVIFEWDPAINVYTKKIDFGGSYLLHPAGPSGNLALNGNKFYGTVPTGNNGQGAIYEWDPVTNVYSKKMDFGSNSRLIGTLTFSGGKAYGLKGGGGIADFGVIFEWDPATNGYLEKVDLVPVNGIGPAGSLTVRGGKFYGVTNDGGSNSNGVIFEWDPGTNIYSKKIDFNASINGSTPYSSLIQHSGKLYGMTSAGGANNKGVIFEIDPVTSVYTKKVDLNDANGGSPNGNSLTLYNGKFYGMTTRGGSNNMGVIFEWDPVTNLYTKKIDFIGANGEEPHGNLTLKSGKFYGMTSQGGANSAGVIFEWDPATNLFAKKHDFDSDDDGYGPYGSLTLAGAKFYGMTRFGGAEMGVIFEWDPATNVYTKKVDLTTPDIGTDGGPLGSLTLCRGKYYGMTLTGGNAAIGEIFEWDPATNSYITKQSFDNGGFPEGSLALGDGKFYGMTGTIGSPGYNLGSFFEWNQYTNVLTYKKIFNGPDGAAPSTGNDLTLVQVPVAKGLRGSCASFAAVTIDNTNNNKWVSITDSDGNAVAEIKANGNNLGIVNSSVFINNVSVREDGSKRLYLDRNITITPQVQPSSVVDIRLYIQGPEYQALKNAFNSNGEPSGFSSINDLGIFKNENSCASSIDVITNPVASAIASWQNDYVLSANVISFSTFYFANKNLVVLPLTLLEFNGRLVNSNGMLSWKTAGEQNTAGFEIERSVDGNKYAVVGTVASQNTTGTHDYSFNDPRITSLGAAVIYYRLKQKDINGRFVYSRIVALSIDKRSIVLFYPNPVKDRANLTVTINQPEQVKARVIDATGKVMSKKQWALPAGSTSLSVDVSRLAKGIYYLELNGATINVRKQFNKQ